MKTSILLSSLLVSVLVFGQNDSLKLNNSKFLNGFWKLTPDADFQMTTVNPIPSVGIFKIISIPNNELNQSFRVGGRIGTTASNLYEGTGVYFESPRLMFESRGIVNSVNGTWSVINDNRTTTDLINWHAHPNIDEGTILFKFEYETEFVITITTEDSVCKDIYISFSLDRQLIGGFNQKHVYYPSGSSFYGKGKELRIGKIKGNCPDKNYISGFTKIYRQ